MDKHFHLYAWLLVTVFAVSFMVSAVGDWMEFIAWLFVAVLQTAFMFLANQYDKLWRYTEQLERQRL